MMKKLQKKYYTMGAMWSFGMLMARDAHAGGNTEGQDFSDIAKNIVESVQDLPGLLAAAAYILGLIFMLLGLLKIKDHVENPTQTPLKDGAVRLIVGGTLFALPIVSEAMFTTIGEGDAASTAQLNKVEWTF